MWFAAYENIREAWTVIHKADKNKNKKNKHIRTNKVNKMLLDRDRNKAVRITYKAKSMKENKKERN